MDIRDVAKDSKNSRKAVERAITEQALSLGNAVEVGVVIKILSEKPSIDVLIARMADKARIQPYNARELRMIAALALSAASWIDADTAESTPDETNTET